VDVGDAPVDGGDGEDGKQGDERVLGGFHGLSG
jgi:hypothetical protein